MGFLGGRGGGGDGVNPLPGKVCLSVLRIQDGGDLLLRPTGTTDQHGKAVWNLLRNKNQEKANLTAD